MIQATLKLLSVALFGCVVITVAGEDCDSFCNRKLSEVTPGTITLKGTDGWLYSSNELSHLAAGKLADGNVVNISKATRKNNADPREAITGFNRQLKEIGIRLIVLPVPPKLAVYPLPGLNAGDAMSNLKPFYEELRSRGVEVLDLSDSFQAASAGSIYCKSDSHWGPDGIAGAAKSLAGLLGLEGDEPLTATRQEMKIAGDLAVSLNKDAAPEEALNLNKVSGKIFDENSPVLLLGDSHILFLSAGGDMLAEHAGLPEQLAFRLKMPLDHIAVKGSASASVRINLYRKAVRNPEWIKGKKVVVWVFSCREFTESTSGWPQIPVLKK